MSVHLVTFLQLIAFTFLSHCNLEFARVNCRLNFLWLLLLEFFFLLLGRFNINYLNAEK